MGSFTAFQKSLGLCERPGKKSKIGFCCCTLTGTRPVSNRETDGISKIGGSIRGPVASNENVCWLVVFGTLLLPAGLLT
jgi:hypothetical protein